jgi:transposase
VDNLNYEEYKQKWAKNMIHLLLEIKEKIEKTKRKELSPKIILEFEKKHKRILNAGLGANPPPPKTNQKKRGRKKKSKARNVLERLIFYQYSVLAFMYNVEVPFDNNQGERDLHMYKVKLKIACLFRSREGAQNFCRIRGYISTVKKKSLNVLVGIKHILDDSFLTAILLKTAE